MGRARRCAARAAPPGAGHAGPARRGDPRAAAARALFRAEEAAGRTRARAARSGLAGALDDRRAAAPRGAEPAASRSEEHTSELQSQSNLVCRLLLEKKKKYS